MWTRTVEGTEKRVKAVALQYPHITNMRVLYMANLQIVLILQQEVLGRTNMPTFPT
jgi:hypothetical protein